MLLLIIDVCFMFTEPEPLYPSDKKTAGRQRIKTYKSAVARENKKLSQKCDELQRQVWKMKKANQRKKEKESSVKALTPRSKVNKELSGQFISPEVKKKLVFAEAVKEDIAKVNVKSTQDKVTICKTLPLKYLAKYKMLKDVNTLVFAKLRKSLRTRPLTEAYKRATSTVRSNNMTKVHDFFLRDDVSAVSPGAGRKNYIKVGNLRKRKRILRGTLTDLYLKFCSENITEKKISYQTFCDLKPCHCVRPKESDRRVCLCSVCENFDLLTKALHQAGAIKESSDKELVRSVCYTEKTEKCLSRSCKLCAKKSVIFLSVKKTKLVKRQKWVKIQEVKEGSTIAVKRTVKQDRSEPVMTLIQEIKESLPKFLSHTFRFSHQHEVLKEVKANLGPGDILIIMDFSENWKCKWADEVQSNYYGASKDSVTIHQGVVYYQDKVRSFCTLSLSPRKDAAGIGAHILPILQLHLQENPGVTSVHFCSDSPTTQYRNKETFYLFVRIIPAIFPQITSVRYNFTEGGHGKTSADGVGGWAKTEADRAINHGQDIGCIEDLLSHLKKKSTKTDIDLIKHEDIVAMEQRIPKKLEPFHGTMQVHQYTWNKEKPSDVYFNSVSCYDCDAGTQCSHFGLPGCPWRVSEMAPAPTPPDVENNNQVQIPSRTSKVASKSFEVGTWVAVPFQGYWYPGQYMLFLKVYILTH